MAHMETPSQILYADLRAFGHISNRAAALILLSPQTSVNGMPIRSRAGTDRTFLSREIVHARPGKYGLEAFNNLPHATQQLKMLVLSHLKDEEKDPASFGQHYRTDACRAMCSAITAAGLDGNLYRNALDKILASDDLPEAAKSHLAFMLFIAAGCLGNPLSAASIVDAYTIENYSCEISTPQTRVGDGYAAAAETQGHDICLGLLRIVNGEAKPPIHPLSTGPEGSVIGALASGAADVTDVGDDVSRRHARIWRENGSWWVEGLNSTNGTVFISGDTRQTTVVEPPRTERGAGSATAPVRIAMSDVLRLGSTTEFLVMRIASTKQ